MLYESGGSADFIMSVKGIHILIDWYWLIFGALSYFSSMIFFLLGGGFHLENGKECSELNFIFHCEEICVGLLAKDKSSAGSLWMRWGWDHLKEELPVQHTHILLFPRGLSQSSDTVCLYFITKTTNFPITIETIFCCWKYVIYKMWVHGMDVYFPCVYVKSEDPCCHVCRYQIFYIMLIVAYK